MKLKEAQELNIEVLDHTTFLDAIEKGGNAIELIVTKNIAPWGGKVNNYLFVCVFIY